MSENAYKQAGVDVEAGLRISKTNQGQTLKRQRLRAYLAESAASADFLKCRKTTKILYLFRVLTV